MTARGGAVASGGCVRHGPPNWAARHRGHSPRRKAVAQSRMYGRRVMGGPAQPRRQIDGVDVAKRVAVPAHSDPLEEPPKPPGL